MSTYYKTRAEALAIAYRDDCRNQRDGDPRRYEVVRNIGDTPPAQAALKAGCRWMIRAIPDTHKKREVPPHVNP